MNYDLLLFDADDTLLDFKKSEDISFQIVLEKNGIRDDTKFFLESYKEINDLLWSQHALGLVSKDFLKVERFKKFLETNRLEGDASQMAEDYLDTLPEQVFLIDGSIEVLQTLHKKIPLVIVTNGIGVTQHKRLHNSNLAPLIDLMVVSEECGFTKPDKRIFNYTFDLLKVTRESSRILMIGDKLETDIFGANNAGIDSCWFNPEKSTNTTPHSPTYEIHSLIDILRLL